MYENLTSEYTICLISDAEIEEFKRVALKYPYLSVLIGKGEVDLFMWRVALDLYHIIGTSKEDVIFLPERAMISPLQNYLLKTFIKSDEYIRLSRTKSNSKYERFVLSITIAMYIKRWSYLAFDGEKDQLTQVYMYGDLFGFIHHAELPLDDLPQSLIKMQADVMKKLREYILYHDTFTEMIRLSVKESKKLCQMLDLHVEECVQWKLKKP